MNRLSTWFKKMGLQGKLISAFLLMALIVFAVGWVGQLGSFWLTQYLDEISEVRLPSIVGLQMLDQGLRVSHAGEMALLNPRLSDTVREDQVRRIQQALQQMQAGRDKYERLPRTPQEEKLWKNFLSKWERWAQEHEEFMRLYQKFEQLGILAPQTTQLDLMRQDRANSPEMAAAQAASVLLEQMNVQVFTINRPVFNSAAQDLEKVLKVNETIAANQKQAADLSVTQTQRWVVLGMIAGPLTAMILGIILSRSIAKPLDRAITGIINEIVSSSTEISATVEQQERIAQEQATSVRQTTTAMDELGASSRQSAEQAEAAAAGASVALTLAEGGSQAVQRTLGGMTELQQKVRGIAGSTVLLSQQTAQIREISSVVRDLAGQTNMLALNAAVEAVRAGEQGKGFAVLAAEIRKLADESKKSADKINALVANIETASNSTVLATDEGTKTVEESVKIAQETADTFRSVSEAIEQICVSNQQIALTSRQQAVAIDQVIYAMNTINAGAKQTASGITQTKVGIDNLKQAAQNIKAFGVG
ncbi:MAG: MCP four helix bundle domain-containing protein [Microcoleus vaginatus WJT46-NPBG5]|nr:MCP four helix bundle domain-containing protein [Microcoleus vaginatus WJT46-NPBG5]